MMLPKVWVLDWYTYNSPLWFFCSLMISYLAFYALCAASRKRPWVYPVAAAALSVLGYVLVLEKWSLPLFNSAVGEGLQSFFLGVILQGLYLRAKDTLLRAVCASTAGVAGLLLALSYVWGMETVLGSTWLFFTMLVAPLLVMGCVCLPVNGKGLLVRSIAILSKGSLSVIVWHRPLYDFLYFYLYGNGRFFNGEAAWVRAVVYWLLLAGICAVSYFLVEKKLGAWLKKKLQ